MYDQIVYPSDNELGIPTLRLDMQAEHLIKPCLAWGSTKRSMQNQGTWHFYVDDYRWTNLLKNPYKLVATKPQACCELNISLYEDTPPALCVSEIFKKRWVSRYFQDSGIKVFVDLFVPEKHRDWNLLGVPKGWRAYSTRGRSKEMDSLNEDHETAKCHRGDDDILFIVFGGGSVVSEWCTLNNSIHVPYKSQKNVYSTQNDC